MKKAGAIPILFVVAALYDGLLGAAFLLAPRGVFNWFAVMPPNHLGYAQFPAALLIIFGIMFWRVAMNPVANRNLIPYGILLKVAYCGVVFFHWYGSGIPNMWKPFAVCDVLFLVAFVLAYCSLGKTKALGATTC